MRSRIISGIAAASLAVTAFVSLGVTASATNYSSQVNASALKANDILVGGSAKIKQDGGTTAWTYKSLLKLTYKTADGKTQLNYTETEDGSTTTVYSTTRYKYWKVASVNKKGYSLNTRYDYEITVNANDPTLTKAPTAKTVTYNGSAQQLAVAGTATNGTVQYKLNNGSWSSSIPTATAAGEYTIAYQVKGNTNYNTLDAVTITTKAKINKANSAFTTEPAAKALTWTGEAQELVTAGATADGTVEYKLGDGAWSTAIPEATAVGEYTVYYRITGDANHNDLAESSVTATIAAKAATATYENIGEFERSDDDKASAWSVTVTPGSTAMESIDVKVNGISSNEGAWISGTAFSGPVQFGVAVNAPAEAIESVTAVVDGEDVETTLVD
ncbi:MAG: hypothetical protein IJH94_05810 [Clostridia bacterium]|nr:hypothetical protein [Clostridia bacterium]